MEQEPYSRDSVRENRFEPQWLTDGAEILRATRWWIQYGVVGFSILCIVIGAVKALLGFD